ncbi:hypothetical protein H4R99_006414 [Coemansia sp. RSA 1722]|nr:hypothetical protein LPJ57_004602 [Coemansia sp. RSA 486]KAJ2592421.1 hypothetical protein H4R99_006414 [Coemansia sp. RSA 1722]KAJ2603197.1 hypothetical protein GGF39_000335 [Coemansia sp. RSA 1721]
MLAISFVRNFVRRPLASIPATTADAVSRRLFSSGSGSDEGKSSEGAEPFLQQTGASMARTGPISDRNSTFASMLNKSLHTGGSQVIGRSVPVATGGAVKAYGRLNRILAENNVRRELSLRKRYEKPKYKRQRLRRESHARRFKDEVRKKVHLIMQMKNWGM